MRNDWEWWFQIDSKDNVAPIQTGSLIRRHRELEKVVTHDFKTTARKETGVDKREDATSVHRLLLQPHLLADCGLGIMVDYAFWMSNALITTKNGVLGPKKATQAWGTCNVDAT